MKKYITLLLVSFLSCYSIAQDASYSEEAEYATEYCEEGSGCDGTTSIMFLDILSVVVFITTLGIHITQKKGKKDKVLDPFATTGILTSVISLSYVATYFLGLFQALESIEMSGDISPTIVAGAFKIIFPSVVRCLIFGLTTVVFGLISRICFKTCVMNKANIILITIGIIVSCIVIMSFYITPLALASAR